MWSLVPTDTQDAPTSLKDAVPQQHPPQKLGCGRTVGRGGVGEEWGEGADEAWGWQAGTQPHQ